MKGEVELWRSMLTIDDFLLKGEDQDDNTAATGGAQDADEEKECKKSRLTESSQEEQIDFFSEVGVAWPPSEVELKGIIGKHTRSALSRRQAEVVYLACRKFQEPRHEEEFLDANFSISRLFGSGRNPWLGPLIFTFTGTSVPVMRRREIDIHGDPTVKIKALTGKEMLQVTGWDISQWQPSALTACANSIERSLAGNAWSAFACAPLMAAVISVLGFADGSPAASASTHTDDSACHDEGSDCSSAPISSD